ncbi:hypothetical protein K8Q98_02000 [Candidatus Nomurabacteria bacterium]|nr:hypothetical protein [Candidatus Nomurabacteria bacterium]
MQKKQLVARIVESFIIFPIVTMPVSFANLPQTGVSIVSTIEAVSSQKQNIESNVLLALNKVSKAIDEADLALEAKANAINTYFTEREMPLEGMGMKMVLEAEKNNIDWRLLPAIAVRESTGGKFACKKATYNSFGWGSCKIGFDSNEHAIEIVAKNLGGNNPNTAKHYDDKTTLQILRAYNPPSVVPRYAEQVIAIMSVIGPTEIVVNDKEVAFNQ